MRVSSLVSSRIAEPGASVPGHFFASPHEGMRIEHAHVHKVSTVVFVRGSSSCFLTLHLGFVNVQNLRRLAKASVVCSDCAGRASGRALVLRKRIHALADHDQALFGAR